MCKPPRQEILHEGLHSVHSAEASFFRHHGKFRVVQPSPGVIGHEIRNDRGKYFSSDGLSPTSNPKKADAYRRTGGGENRNAKSLRGGRGRAGEMRNSESWE